MHTMERDEVKDMITAETAGPLARIEGDVSVILVKIGHIETHVKDANGKTAANVLKIEEIRQKVEKLEQNLPHTPINCPQNGTLQEMKTILEKIKEKKPLFEELIHDYTTRKTKKTILKDTEEGNIRTRQEERADAMKRITTISVAIAALALVVNLALSVSSRWEQSKLKKGQNALKEEVDMINTPVRTRGGAIQWWPSGVLIDSLKANGDTLSFE